MKLAADLVRNKFPLKISTIFQCLTSYLFTPFIYYSPFSFAIIRVILFIILNYMLFQTFSTPNLKQERCGCVDSDEVAVIGYTPMPKVKSNYTVSYFSYMKRELISVRIVSRFTPRPESWKFGRAFFHFMCIN